MYKYKYKGDNADALFRLLVVDITGGIRGGGDRENVDFYIAEITF